jgi:catechol 2,3-dioxygenase-like lactoylglutathione lyase family enzyme
MCGCKMANLQTENRMEDEPCMEGLPLTVADVNRSINYYRDRLGFVLEWEATPQFAMLRIGGLDGGTIGLLHWDEARKEGAQMPNVAQAPEQAIS